MSAQYVDDCEDEDQHLTATFARYLFRPYLDFGPADLRAPHHVVGLDFAVRALLEGRDYPHIQASMNPSFRSVLLHATGLTDVGITSNVDADDLTILNRRKIIDELCSSFKSNSVDTQRRLAWVLIKAGFHYKAETLLAAALKESTTPLSEQSDLAFALAYARYRQFVDEPSRQYSVFEFENIATNAEPGIALVDATYQVVVQAVKHRLDVDSASYWQEKHRKAIEKSDAILNEFQRLFAMSRFHRVGGFIPQIRKQPNELRSEMDKAEQFAREIKASDSISQVAADEVLFPVLESRVREALFLNERDRALKYAEELVRLAPSDARAWLLFGEVLLENDMLERASIAYGRAQWFAPPGKEIALFMRAQCLRNLGDTESAFQSLLDATTIDPMGISAIEAMDDLSIDLANPLLEDWVKKRLVGLQALRVQPVARHAWPYKKLPPVKDLQ